MMFTNKSRLLPILIALLAAHPVRAAERPNILWLVGENIDLWYADADREIPEFARRHAQVFGS